MRLLSAHVVLSASGDARDDWKRGLALAREMRDSTRVMPALLNLARGSRCSGDSTKRVHSSPRRPRRRGQLRPISDLLFIVAGDARSLGIAPEVVELIGTAPGQRRTAPGRMRHSRMPPEILCAPRRSTVARGAFDRSRRALQAAEWLVEGGRTAEGLAELEKALAFYRSVRATFFLERGEARLAEAQRDST